ncbi:MAG: hypothetical protein WDA65_02480 [Christensenellales bacterium]
MFCTKCGMQITCDGQFCIHCGAPVKEADTPQAASAGTVRDAQPASAFSTYYTQPHGEGQPPARQPKKKKAKIIIIAAAGVVLAAALAAVLLLTVFTQSEGWPFSGKTMQTRFVNDSIAVFDRAFGDISFGKMDEINSQPFDLSYAHNMTVPNNGEQETQTKMSYNFAYDEQTLGIKTIQETGSTTLLLVEDTLYIDIESDYFGQSFNYTTGFKFDAKADLSKPMTLEDRFAAIFAGEEIDVDLIRLFELFFNSIDEDCFDKNNTRTTLRMSGSDISQMLKTFADKLSEDEELNDSLKSALEKLVGVKINLPDVMPLLSIALKSTDIELIWTVRYDDAGLPRRVEISAEDGGSNVFDFAFEAQRQGETRDMLMELSVPSSYQDFDFFCEMELVPLPDGLKFSGILTANSAIIKIKGSEVWDGYDFSGSIKVDIPRQGVNAKLDFNGTLAIGNPPVPVAGDERFAVDTENAELMDLNEIISMQGQMPLF